METPSQLHLGGTTLCQAHQLRPSQQEHPGPLLIPSIFPSQLEGIAFQILPFQVSLLVIISLPRTINMVLDGTSIFRNQSGFSSDGYDIIKVIIKALLKNEIGYKIM